MLTVSRAAGRTAFKSTSCKTITRSQSECDRRSVASTSKRSTPLHDLEKGNFLGALQRRDVFLTAGLIAADLLWRSSQQQVLAADYEPMEALKGKDYGKPRMRFPDYELTESGLQYKNLREGTGGTPTVGSTCVIDWDGYTIGYYGRPFEARNKAKGGAFVGEEKDFYRFVLGDNKVIPAFEEAVATMKVGGIRRIIVPVEIGYPDNDFTKKGPAPVTFSGKRTLDFVLKNQGLIDKTLLFDIELVKVVN